MAFSDQPKPLSTFKILWEAIKLPTTNCTLILPILLLSFLSSSLLFFFNYLSTAPLLTDLTAKYISIATTDPKSPEYSLLLPAIHKDLKELTAIEVVYLITSFIVSSLLAIATIHVLSLTFSGKVSTIKDFLSKLSWASKGPMITQLYVTLFNLGYIFLVLVLIGVILLISHGSLVLIAPVVIVVLLVLILYLYLVMVWSVSVVISVVVDGCYGLEAIVKAGELIRGKRRQGILIVLIEWVMASVIYVPYNLAIADVPPYAAARLAFGFVVIVISVMMNMFILAVNVVFYDECKKSHGEEGIAMEGGGGFIYTSVPTAAHVDEAFP